jgi:hypothetical protein
MASAGAPATTTPLQSRKNTSVNDSVAVLSQLKSIHSATDHLVLLFHLGFLMVFLFFIGQGITSATLARLDRKLSGLLVDTSTWQAYQDIHFRCLPNGKVEVRSTDGLQMLSSVAKFERFVAKRDKQAGRAVDTVQLSGKISAATLR